MSGDTAKLLASLDLQDAMSPKLKTAMGNVSAAERGVGSLSTRLSGFASNLKGNVSNALSTFGSRVKQIGFGLTAALGIGGLLSFSGALKSSLEKAQSWGLQIEKLQGITHDSAVSLSGLLAVTEKYGLSNERLAQITGFTMKAIGNLTKGVDDQGHAVKGALEFVKTYGFNIYDAQGKVKSFSQLLLTFSDYWVKDKNRSEAAAAAAKLFGRGYADLVPILNLGSKGIRAAEEEAKALGLTLTQDNVVALAKAREATRQWGDALGGLELQVGLALLPRLTDLAKAATAFVSGHRGDIVTFFRNAADTAKSAAGTIGDLVGTIGKFWSSIPEGFRDLLIKSIVADRTVKFLFGFSPIGAAFGGISTAISRAIAGGLAKTVATAGIGKLFVQPVFVTNPGFGGLGGGLSGAAGSGAAALAPETLGAFAAGLATIAAGIALPLIMFAVIPKLFANGGQQQSVGRTIGGSGFNYDPTRYGGFGSYNNIPGGTGGTASTPTATSTGMASVAFGIQRGAFLIEHATDRLASQFVRFLRENTAIVHAIKGVEHGIAYDRAAIAKGETGPRTQLVLDELKTAVRIAGATESTDKKIADLKKIQAELKAHGDTIAQRRIGDLIAAVRAKALAVKTNVSTSINVQVNGSQTTSTLNTYSSGYTFTGTLAGTH